MKTYDLIVIGAGPGGTPAAMAAAQFGKSVLLVDKRGEPGGECLFEGCIPSKVLENAANRFAMLKEVPEFHIDFEAGARIHWDGVLRDKDALLQKRSMGALKQMEALPTLMFKAGAARFVDEKTIEVDGETFGFVHAVVATGAAAHVPSLKGSGVTNAWTNADVFKQKKIPDELVFVGAGAVSCELAQMFNKLGTKCRILERGGRILKSIDEASALMVQKKMADDGIMIDLNVKLGSIDEKEGLFTISYKKNDDVQTLQTPHVLLATGRSANVEEIGLEAAGVAYDRHGIAVNAQLQTSQPHIYAVGDCNTGPKFAHWATYEAGIAVHNMYAPNKHETDPDKLNWVLFSDPQIASAGLSEADALKRGIEVTVERYDYAVDARAQIDKAPLGMLQFVIDKKSGIIVGVQAVGEDSSSLSGEAGLVIAHKMTVTDVMKAIHPHPTLSEAFGFLAKNTFFKSMLSARRK